MFTSNECPMWVLSTQLQTQYIYIAFFRSLNLTKHLHDYTVYLYVAQCHVRMDETQGILAHHALDGSEVPAWKPPKEV